MLIGYCSPTASYFLKVPSYLERRSKRPLKTHGLTCGYFSPRLTPGLPALLPVKNPLKNRTQPGGAVVLRIMSSVGRVSHSGSLNGSCITSNNSLTPFSPDSTKSCLIVVKPKCLAISTSSYPITDKSSGMRSPASRAASITPIACVSLAVKIAVGLSGMRSIFAVMIFASERLCSPCRCISGHGLIPAASSA